MKPRALYSLEPRLLRAKRESAKAIAETDEVIASGDYDTYDDAASLLAAAGA